MLCLGLQDLSRQKELTTAASQASSEDKTSAALRAAQQEISDLKERLVESAEQRASTLCTFLRGGGGDTTL